MSREVGGQFLIGVASHGASFPATRVVGMLGAFGWQYLVYEGDPLLRLVFLSSTWQYLLVLLAVSYHVETSPGEG